jgi:hypothetical protein
MVDNSVTEPPCNFKACAERDIGVLFRLLRNGGMTQRQISQLVKRSWRSLVAVRYRAMTYLSGLLGGSVSRVN